MSYARKSQTVDNKIYFWTATIHKWCALMCEKTTKEIVLSALKTLSERRLITVYAFVIMPTHLHLIWKLNSMPGFENPKSSFMKFTAHVFKKELRLTAELEKYKVSARNKKYQFWQRDSLAIEIDDRNIAIQKLDYIHANPVSGKWQLAKDDVTYYYSSARFYEFGIDQFGFLNDLLDEF
jgi:putative transposase